MLRRKPVKFPRPSILKYPYIPWQLKQRPDGDRPHLPASSFLVQEHSHSPSAAIPPTQAQRRERLYIATVSSTPHAWPYNYKYLALQQHLRCFNLKDKEDQLPEILQKLINSDYSLGQYFKQVMGCCSGNPSPASPCLEILLAFATSNELLFPRLAGRNQHQYASTKTPLQWSFASQPKIESSAPSCMKRNRYTVKSESMSL